MRLLAFLLIAAVILSLTKAVTLVLIVLLAISILWALITRPLELFGLLALGLLSNALAARPAVTIIALAGTVVLLANRKPLAEASMSNNNHAA